MFPIKRIEQLHQEIYYYYLQAITFQDKGSQYYEDIVNKFSKNLSELDTIIEEMRKYNNKNNNLLINANK